MSPHSEDTPTIESNGLNGNGTTENLNDFPIAIIGMACRFPQDAENTEKFWDLLINGRSAMTEFPPEKMTTEAHYHPDPSHAGTVSQAHTNLELLSDNPIDELQRWLLSEAQWRCFRCAILQHHQK
jgi:hypothetical protein